MKIPSIRERSQQLVNEAGSVDAAVILCHAKIQSYSDADQSIWRAVLSDLRSNPKLIPVPPVEVTTVQISTEPKQPLPWPWNRLIQ